MFRRLYLALALVCPLATARGQRIAPAAVVVRVTGDSLRRIVPDLSASLSHDVKHGAVVGSITGAVVGLAGVAAYVWFSTRETCCEQPAHDVRFNQIVAIEVVATAAGGLAGAILGYSYHFSRPGKSASRSIQPNER